MTIPKLIFQTWKSKTEMPENWRSWSSTFKRENPTYAYRLWDDADNRAFIHKNFPWFIERYDSYPAEIYRADAIRYFFLYLYGGIYADMDTECLRSLDSVTNESGVVLGRMGSNPGFEHSIPNAVMASEPRQEFWLFVMSLMLDPPASITNQRPEYRTGPVLLKLAHDTYTTKYRDDVVQNRIANVRVLLNQTEQAASTEKTEIILAPATIFFPLDWNDQVHETYVLKGLRNGHHMTRDDALGLFPNSLTATYWSHSWEPKND
jgi:inositol phosphorylceramide mannosyltransferase catalytic subunit